jgi:hypothetical protein
MSFNQKMIPDKEERGTGRVRGYATEGSLTQNRGPELRGQEDVCKLD